MSVISDQSRSDTTRVKPTSIVLDLLHSHIGHTGSVRSIMRVGALFGFSQNTMRVTLSRLVSRGLLESPRRGSYRLSDSTSALNRFVDGWRQGEARCRAWRKKQWLICHRSGATMFNSEEKKQSKGGWALESLGLREVREHLWARPDNLASSRPLLLQQLFDLGLESDALLLGPCSIEAEIADAWRQIWDTQVLEARYRKAILALKESAAELPSLGREDAMLQSFSRGGEVIHLLAKDPLLPEEWLNIQLRETLWKAMLDYEEQGKAVWAEPEHQAPTHLPRPQQPLVCI